MDDSKVNLAAIEEEIDSSFAANPCASLPYAQAMWTLLSAVEEHHFKMLVVRPLAKDAARANIDMLINMLTHPLRVCERYSDKRVIEIQYELVDARYSDAMQWLEQSEDYARFCTLFSLYHGGDIQFEVDGQELISSDWRGLDLSYEAYDRIVDNRDIGSPKFVDSRPAVSVIEAHTAVLDDKYTVSFAPELMDVLDTVCRDAFSVGHVLPREWAFCHFSITQFREVIIAMQAMTYCWFVARGLTASTGIPGMMYSSSVWTPKKQDLLNILCAHTNIPRPDVEKILEYLTFGKVGIRNPDVATQPLIDLLNDQFAISPFVLIHSDAERNLCALLNQIPCERDNYSRLVDQKEVQAREDLVAYLEDTGLDFKHGELGDTDIDLAIIDRGRRTCLCVEIKWFIEPAEIREVRARSEEIAKGVEQARSIDHKFRDGERRLMDLLEIDDGYEFLSIVGSMNFIGGEKVQHPDVPVVKLWHLADRVTESDTLADVLGWLRNREYLPREGHGFRAEEVRFTVGNWNGSWYGLSIGPGSVDTKN